MIYVNSDASYRDGWAGIAYESAVLGSDSRLVACASSTETELLALLLAMSAVQRARLAGGVMFRTDCKATVQPHRGESEALRPLRDHVAGCLAEHHDHGWQLRKVARFRNVLANVLARRALRTLAEASLGGSEVRRPRCAGSHGSLLPWLRSCAGPDRRPRRSVIRGESERGCGTCAKQGWVEAHGPEPARW